MFLYGGRDAHDAPLSDLWRYNTTGNSWAQLSPVNFDVALFGGSAIGSNLILSKWGYIIP